MVIFFPDASQETLASSVNLLDAKETPTLHGHCVMNLTTSKTGCAAVAQRVLVRLDMAHHHDSIDSGFHGRGS